MWTTGRSSSFLLLSVLLATLTTSDSLLASSGRAHSVASSRNSYRLDPLQASDSGKSSRKRRIKGTVTTPSAPSSSSSSSTSSSLDNDDDRVTNDSPFQRPDIASPAFNLAKADSKLPPLSGSLEERQAAYNEKSGLQRSVEELLAPTPSGKEPKIVGLAKTVTWGAVILLVLLEIVVSIKVGGAPFDFSNKSGAAVDGKAAPAPMPDRSKLQYGYEAE